MKNYFIILLLIFSSSVFAQNIPSDTIIIINNMFFEKNLENNSNNLNNSNFKNTIEYEKILNTNWHIRLGLTYVSEKSEIRPQFSLLNIKKNK
jgi:hypothetical protein